MLVALGGYEPHVEETSRPLSGLAAIAQSTSAP